jgi:hypothetical protein
MGEMFISPGFQPPGKITGLPIFGVIFANIEKMFLSQMSFMQKS